jgi:vacuolar-type H+-ATPase subunit E/Vma4
VALSDILNRIASDAAHEAKAIIESANSEAENIVSAAAGHAADSAARFEHTSARKAEQDAETIVAGARLSARDAEVLARGELVERGLAALEERIVGMPDASYTAFIAQAVADAAIGGETVLVAAADVKRLAGLEAAVADIARERGRELSLRFAAEPADVAHGVVLLGDRSRNDLSVAGLVGAQRESLVMSLASVLFGEGNGKA